MSCDGGIHQHRLGMARLDHRVHVFEEQAVGQGIFLRVPRDQVRVRVHNAHQLHVAVLRQLRQKAFDVSVLQPNDRHAYGRGLRMGRYDDRRGYNECEPEQAAQTGSKINMNRFHRSRIISLAPDSTRSMRPNADRPASSEQSMVEQPMTLRLHP